MNPLAELSAALRGWTDIVAGKAPASGDFRTDGSGLAVALASFLVAVLLGIAAQSAAIGMPSMWQVLYGILVQIITIALIGAVLMQALRMWANPTPLNAIFVPVLYGLALVQVIAIPLALIAPGLAILAIAVAGALIFRAAQVVAGLPLLRALGLAIVCVIVLVVVPNALYMLAFLIPTA